MKILLIQPKLNWDLPPTETPSRALLILGTLALNCGHEVKILHLNKHDLDAELKSYQPDIAAITCNTFQVASAREIIKTIKSQPRYIKTILGGPHAPAWKPEDGHVDKVVIGEGENAWLEFIGEKPSIKTIDDIPIPNFALVDLKQFGGVKPVGAYPSMAIMGSRGCPFECTFCNTPVFWGKKMRYRDPGNILKEINLLHHKYGVKEIFFQDDTFNVNLKWASTILNRIIADGLNKKMIFKIDCRVNENLLTEEFLDLCAKAGVWNIFLGIESCSQTILDRAKKGITVAEIKRAIKIIKDRHMSTQCSFIIGLPGETAVTLKETNDLINETQPTSLGWGYACPFPATELDKEVSAKGYKLNVGYEKYGYGQILCRTDDLTYQQLDTFKGFTYELS